MTQQREFSSVWGETKGNILIISGELKWLLKILRFHYFPEKDYLLNNILYLEIQRSNKNSSILMFNPQLLTVRRLIFLCFFLFMPNFPFILLIIILYNSSYFSCLLIPLRYAVFLTLMTRTLCLSRLIHLNISSLEICGVLSILL